MFIREHELANEHKLTLAANKKAEKTIERMKAADRAKAKLLREKAEKMLSEASDLEYEAGRYALCDRYKAKKDEIEEAGYWTAREIIGTLPRDENDDYIDPAPFWRVSYKGEDLGTFQGEQGSDILRLVCPADDPREWHHFTLVRV